jgi:hypothetical protein
LWLSFFLSIDVVGFALVDATTVIIIIIIIFCHCDFVAILLAVVADPRWLVVVFFFLDSAFARVVLIEAKILFSLSLSPGCGCHFSFSVDVVALVDVTTVVVMMLLAFFGSSLDDWWRLVLRHVPQ